MRALSSSVVRSPGAAEGAPASASPLLSRRFRTMPSIPMNAPANTFSTRPASRVTSRWPWASGASSSVPPSRSFRKLPWLSKLWPPSRVLRTSLSASSQNASTGRPSLFSITPATRLSSLLTESPTHPAPVMPEQSMLTSSSPMTFATTFITKLLPLAVLPESMNAHARGRSRSSTPRARISMRCRHEYVSPTTSRSTSSCPTT